MGMARARWGDQGGEVLTKKGLEEALAMGSLVVGCFGWSELRGRMRSMDGG